MWALENEITQFPGIVILALLPHPSVMVWSANLFQDTLSRSESHTNATASARRGTGSDVSTGASSLAQDSRILGTFGLFLL